MFPMQEDKNQEDCKVLGNFVPCIKIIMDFCSQKLAQTHYQCLEFAIIAQILNEFLLTLALKIGDIYHDTINSLVIPELKLET